jgi:lipid-binding SYLF domain-containing protein
MDFAFIINVAIQISNTIFNTRGSKMKASNVLSVIMAVFFTIGFSLASMAQSPEEGASAETEEMNPTSDQAADKQEKSRAEKAAEVLTKQMEQPEDKRIPSDLLSNAKCIAVFPSVVKAGFIVAAKRGNGLVSCRHEDTQEWGAPAFFKITGASVGFQAGVQSASIIMLFMDQNGVDVLASGKMSLGGAGVNVSAGPVGGNIGTDNIKSSVITYGKSKGVFAGIDVEGSSLTYGKASNDEAYGKELSPLDLLLKTDEVPGSLTVFQETLDKYAAKSESEADETIEQEQNTEEDSSKAEKDVTEEEPAQEEVKDKQ